MSVLSLWLMVLHYYSTVIERYFQDYEPQLINACKAKKLKRKQFYAAGVNVLWCQDQHDKWKYKFGLCFHVCVDPFSGYLLWLKIWWNNSNPMLVFSFYADTVRSLGCQCSFSPGAQRYIH